MTCKKLYILLFLFAVLVSCNQDVEQPAQLDMTLCLPANEIIHRAGGPRRVMGDPGLVEQFELPKYAYVFVMKNEDGNTWEVWKSQKMELNTSQWVKTRYNGALDTRHDSIFRYSERIVFPLHKERPMGRVYTICSNMDLNFDSDGKDWDELSDLEDLLNLKFNTKPDSIQENLQNIYSTPYNYAPAGDYYCSFDCSTGFSYHVDMLLYHVAAKVDIKWNVADSVRIKSNPAEAVRLTYMEARRLFDGYAYCFKPMKNELPSLPGSGEGYTVANIVTPLDEGLWWEGRSYFYTIPYYVSGEANYFPLQMLMGTNGETKNDAGYELTLKQMMDTSSVFVPWLRGDFKLSKPLETKSETKVIGS